MHVLREEPLSKHTTFRIGGRAALYIVVASEEEVAQAYEEAAHRGLSVYPLGEGSNVLVGDDDLQKAILAFSGATITYKEHESHVEVSADAGVNWDMLVQDVGQKSLWGIENLAYIPGTVGAAPVQNIGAYGAEVADTIQSVRVFDPAQRLFMDMTKEECLFGYRTSVFKQKPGLYITRVTFRLSKTPSPNLAYPDVQKRISDGVVVRTPNDIGALIRDIRSQKFPDLQLVGTAGSFFKNPVISKMAYEKLLSTYPDLPGYEQEEGVKVSLAWILDHMLSLRGYKRGRVRLFEKQPLVLVSEIGATAHEVNVLAEEITKKVFIATGINIEPEVRSLT